MSGPRCWIAVASAEHVRLGRRLGFMQVCHGKLAPLRRLRPGDGVVYYSPTTIFGGCDGLQSFTALGVVKPGEAYQVDMGGGFLPFRRDVDWWPSKEAAIRPLLGRLSFSAGNKKWGYALRFGLFEISWSDFSEISAAMGATLGIVPENIPAPVTQVEPCQPRLL